MENGNSLNVEGLSKELCKELSIINRELEGIQDEKLRDEAAINTIKLEIQQIIPRLHELTIDYEDYHAHLKSLIYQVIKNYTELLNGYNSNYRYNSLLEKYNHICVEVQNLSTEIKRIGYLKYIGNEENNVILVGGNGSGKSSFASYLKDSSTDNIVVIPAQKFLVFDKNIDKLHLTNKGDVNHLQKDNLIGRTKNEEYENDYIARRFKEDLSVIFSKLVTVVVNEQVSEEHKLLKSGIGIDKKIENTLLFQLQGLWRSLIPDVELDIDTTNRTILPSKEGVPYLLNAMSDGEKAILYYICHVLLAEKNSFIVVDEPETFLNASNFNRLWDVLESYRSDCKFIYISHVIDFITTRSNADLLWCKSYTYPDDWSIERVDSQHDLLISFPKDLLSEILGVRKPILFCEGEKGSLDYLVYSRLFIDEAVVCPIEGHKQVIQYTKAYNNSDVLNNKAYGIIDSDLMSAEQIVGYKQDRIYTLPFNEIEMLYFSDEVMMNVLEHTFGTEGASKKIEKFKEKLKEVIASQKKYIIQQKLKKYLDYYMSETNVSKLSSGQEMITELKSKIDEVNIEQIEEGFTREIEDALSTGEYNRILLICSLKKKITKDLSNTLLDKDYLLKAKVRIKEDRNLIDLIKNKYFSDIHIESD